MALKTRAEIQTAYRERKLQEAETVKKPKKSRAEIQKVYRERKKENESAYKEAENSRKRKSYVPVSNFTETVKRHRRLDNQEKSRQFRARKRASRAEREAGSQVHMSDEEERGSTPQPQLLIVKMDFNVRCKGTRKRISRSLSKANRKLHALSEEKNKLQRKTWALQKKIQRSSATNKGTKIKVVQFIARNSQEYPMKKKHGRN